ncbi:MAG TPA: base excision DNA repair protein [Acidobacteriaceae bacterium]|jgi:endonuclease-3 related protein|nr:base excision DNA repair protein [Acidobacteriaceae bacterium]
MPPGQSAAQQATAAKALQAMVAALFAAYGPQHWWPAETRFEMIVGAYLTQATAWRSVERSLENLRTAGLLHIDGIRKTPAATLRELIRPSGFVQRKAASILAFVDFLDEQYDGSLDRLCRQVASVARPQLLSLPGVGPETADAILLYALDHPAIVVDEYLRRVTVRHGLLTATASDHALRALATTMLERRMQDTEVADAKEFHALIVEVGKRHCGSVAKCAGCPLEMFLPQRL